MKTKNYFLFSVGSSIIGLLLGFLADYKVKNIESILGFSSWNSLFPSLAAPAYCALILMGISFVFLLLKDKAPNKQGRIILFISSGLITTIIGLFILYGIFILWLFNALNNSKFMFS